MALAKCFAQKGTLENLIFKTGLFKECVILQELTGYIYITLSAGSVWEHSFKLQDGSVKNIYRFSIRLSANHLSAKRVVDFQVFSLQFHQRDHLLKKVLKYQLFIHQFSNRILNRYTTYQSITSYVPSYPNL